MDSECKSPAFTMDPVFLTEDQVAALLNVEVSAVRSWRYYGNGPAHYHAGKFVRYDKVEVLAWFAQRRRKKVRKPLDAQARVVS